jgi:cell division septum initiation protein DivIVA
VIHQRARDDHRARGQRAVGDALDLHQHQPAGRARRQRLRARDAADSPHRHADRKHAFTGRCWGAGRPARSATS